MKRFLFFVLTVNIVGTSFAFQYLQKGLSWQNLYEGGGYLVSETLHSDTIINGKEYLHYQGFLLRDDSTGLYFYSQRCDSDYLLFQYGAEEGDSILIYNSQYPTPSALIDFCDSDDIGYWEGVYAIVSSVDTIRLLNGEYRRRVYYGEKWYIEGIGGFRGIKGENYDSEGYFPEMLCCYIGDTLLWARNDCEQWQSKYPTACLGYTPLKTADTWHCVEAYYDFAAQAITNYTAVTYSLQGDTIFGGTVYQTLRRGDGVYCGALRLSADGQQVFYRPGELGGLHQSSKGKEYLLYDFSVNVGDTVYAYDGFMDTSCEQSQEPGDSITPAWKVLSIDTIDGRKHIKVEGGNHQSRVEWIEGIGTCNLLFSRTMHCLTGYTGTWTLCAADSKGNTLYSYNVDHLGIHNDCPTWRLIDDALPSLPSDNALNRKFLRDGHIYIETPLGTFDATGQQIE